MHTLTHIAKGMWQELTQTREFPTAAVQENIRVAEDAIQLAKQFKKETPEFTRRVFLEAAALLDIDLAR